MKIKIAQHDSGKSVSALASYLGLSHSTTFVIQKDKEQISMGVKVSGSIKSTITKQTAGPIYMEE